MDFVHQVITRAEITVLQTVLRQAKQSIKMVFVRVDITRVEIIA
jgi:hypothetical protein